MKADYHDQSAVILRKNEHGYEYDREREEEDDAEV